MEFEIAIPSHRRAKVLASDTLATLQAGGAPMDKVKVFLSDNDDHAEYAGGLLPPKQFVVTGANDVVEKFNAIHSHYPKGTKVFVMEDDIQLVYGSGKTNDARPVDDICKMVHAGFEAVGQEGLWGIVPHNNAFYFSGGVTHTLKLIVAHAFGFVATGDPWLAVSQLGKSDYERTCRYWVRYGRVTRLDNYGAKTKSYTRPGGMQSDMDKSKRALVEEMSVDYLVRRFPHLLARKEKKTSPFAEMRFLSCKFSQEELVMYQRANDRSMGETLSP